MAPSAEVAPDSDGLTTADQEAGIVFLERDGVRRHVVLVALGIGDFDVCDPVALLGHLSLPAVPNDVGLGRQLRSWASRSPRSSNGLRDRAPACPLLHGFHAKIFARRGDQLSGDWREARCCAILQADNRSGGRPNAL